MIHRQGNRITQYRLKIFTRSRIMRSPWIHRIVRIPGSRVDRYHYRREDVQVLVGRVARIGLIGSVICIYSGVAQFIFIASTLLLYGFYLLMVGLILLCLVTDRRSFWGIRSVWAYLYWVSLYAIWSLLVSTMAAVTLPEAFRLIFRNYLVIIAVVIALNNFRNFIVFNYLVQVAILANTIICLWQLGDPQLIWTLAKARDPLANAFNILRPAGLWVNPDEAAFACLFAFLISFKSRGLFFVLARIGAIGGIYLSASRTGVYILLLYALITLIFAIKYGYINLIRIVSVVCGGSILLTMLFFSLFGGVLPSVDLSDNLTLARILDFREDQYASSHTRTEVTSMAFDAVMQSPIQGHGFLAFQRPDSFLPTHLFNTDFRRLNNGAHNIYLVVWGEAGISIFLAYLFVLGAGVISVFRAKITPSDRLIAGLLWLTYLIIGLVWHVQLTYMLGIVFIALICHFPWIMEQHYTSNKPSLATMPRYI